jgi:NTE family protein
MTTAFVLPGGGGRGAYQAGVLRYLASLFPRDLGRPLPLDLLCGTSIGSLNAAMMGAFADDPELGAERLCQAWYGLHARELLRPAPLHALAQIGRCDGLPQFGLFDERALLTVIRDAVPFWKLHEQIRTGRVAAVTVSATHVASGTTSVFVEQRGPLAPWSGDPTVSARAARLEPLHLLASSAIPMLFPPVAIDNELYCEGGLRQNVPLGPALRLGADRIIVITPHHVTTSAALAAARTHAVTSPFFLAGKLLNALLLDRVDADIDRLHQLDEVLRAGQARFGADFVTQLNGALPRPLSLTRTVVIRPSENLGRMAATFVASPEMQHRLGGVAGRALRILAELESHGEADLVSYLLFDGEFARWLIDLGERDARAHHDELCALFDCREAQSPSPRSSSDSAA